MDTTTSVAEIDLKSILETYGAHCLKVDSEGRVFAVTIYSEYLLDTIVTKFFPLGE